MKWPGFILVYSVVYFSAQQQSFAQNSTLRFENYTTENGLPQNSGYAIEQTAEGFMWFGTQDGLCRFDGYRIKIYKNNQSDSSSICGNQVNTLCTDNKGNLWIGTPNGVCIYLRETDQFTSPSAYLGYPSMVDKLHTQYLLEGTDKNIWVVTANKGLFLLQTNNKKTSSFFTDSPEILLLGEIRKDERNNICISTGEDIFRFDGSVFKPLNISKLITKNNKGLNISHFLFANNELWLATVNNGLLRINLVTNQLVEQFDRRNKTWQLKKNEITDLLKDNKNNIWVGTTSNGIYKYNLITGQLANGSFNGSDKYSIRKNYIISLFLNKQGITWIGTSGGGIAKYDPGKFMFQQVTLADNKGNQAPDNMIMALLHIPGNGFLAGTQTGGIIKADRNFGNPGFYKNNSINNRSVLYDNVYQIFQGNESISWLATWGGLCSFNNLTGEFTGYTDISDNIHREFYSIAAIPEQKTVLLSGTKGLYSFNIAEKKWQACLDKGRFLENHLINGRFMWREPGKEIIWICTEGNGLIQYSFKQGIFRQFPQEIDKYKTVRHLYKNIDSLWLATDNGLILVNEKTGQTEKVYDTRHGLPGNVVYSVLPDDLGNLWISTNNGISCFNKKNEIFKNYNESNGLQGAEFNTASCCTDEKGRLYFGGINGINYFSPSEITYNDYTTPSVITGISVMNKPFTANGNAGYLKKIELPYNQNFISIEYSNPNYSHTSSNSYAYMLKGIDKEWIDAGNSTVATYTNLPPGKYMFLVKAANNEGVWNKEPTSLSIVINPPFWATWWFRTIYISLIAGFIFLYTSQRIKNIRHRAELDKQLSTFEMKALHAQMNPHFIFNCLNSIKDMILQGENKNASRYLSSFAQLIRETLEHSKHTFISLHESLTHLERYIEMEKLRFENFSCRIETDNNINLNEIMVPPMLLQPLVENAIWHGLQPLTGEKRLEIFFRKRKHELLCIIEDNGIGLNQSLQNRQQHKNYNSIAIENITKRISLLNEKHLLSYKLHLADKKELKGYTGSGTVATLTIPINKD